MGWGTSNSQCVSTGSNGGNTDLDGNTVLECPLLAMLSVLQPGMGNGWYRR